MLFWDLLVPVLDDPDLDLGDLFMPHALPRFVYRFGRTRGRTGGVTREGGAGAVHLTRHHGERQDVEGILFGILLRCHLCT